jgi:hypothetical protein
VCIFIAKGVICMNYNREEEIGHREQPSCPLSEEEFPRVSSDVLVHITGGSMSDTEKGAIGGAAVGAVLGTVTGAIKGGKGGAALGVVAGAGLGAAVGAAVGAGVDVEGGKKGKKKGKR